jgi:hypothetical protein
MSVPRRERCFDCRPKGSRTMAKLATFASCAVAVATVTSPAEAQDAAIHDVRPAAILDAEPFTRIRGIAELADGRLLVTDQTEKALWRVDLPAGTRERIGTEGQGPNEYEMPIGVHPFRGDTMIVIDFGASRMSFLDRSLAMARTMPLFVPELNIAQGADRRGHLWGDGRTAVLLRRRDDPRASDLAPVLRHAIDSGRVDTIAEVRVPGVGVQPYPEWDGYSIGPDGRLLLVRNQDEYRVEWVLPDGRHVRGPVVDEERRRLTSRDRTAWHEKNPRGAAAGMTRMGGTPAAAPPPVTFPDRFPYANHGQVWVDGRGRGWVQRVVPASDTRPQLDVFDEAGRRIHRLRLPEERQVIHVGERGIYAIRVDDDGLQWLERYDVP